MLLAGFFKEISPAQKVFSGVTIIFFVLTLGMHTEFAKGLLVNFFDRAPKIDENERMILENKHNILLIEQVIHEQNARVMERLDSLACFHSKQAECRF